MEVASDPMPDESEQTSGIECWNCERSYNPTASRWSCPWCHARDTCCEGAAQ